MQKIKTTEKSYLGQVFVYKDLVVPGRIFSRKVTQLRLQVPLEPYFGELPIWQNAEIEWGNRKQWIQEAMQAKDFELVGELAALAAEEYFHQNHRGLARTIRSPGWR